VCGRSKPRCSTAIEKSAFVDDTASVIADGRVVTLSGGAGNDTLSGANARLNVSGGDGDDLLSGAGPNADVLAGDGATTTSRRGRGQTRLTAVRASTRHPSLARSLESS